MYSRVAALYDVHGNLPALEAVLSEMQMGPPVDAVVVGGDVYPGPLARECHARLLEISSPLYFVRGNGEREVSTWHVDPAAVKLPPSVRETIAWNASQLSATQADALRRWPLTQRLTIMGLGEVLFCHATPADDLSIVTQETPLDAVQQLLEPADANVVVCGHTHMAYCRHVGSKQLINAGSIGMPFGQPGAHWLLLDAKPTLRRTPYHSDTAAARIRETDYPQKEEFVQRAIMSPPSEHDMLAVFHRR